MYRFLGWFNVAAFILMTSPYWLRMLNKYVLKWRGPRYSALIKGLRVLHKPLGIVFALTAPLHGFLALGAFRLHTGTILGILVLVTAVLGAFNFFLKKKGLLLWHRRAALLVFLLELFHLLFPSALYYIFGV